MAKLNGVIDITNLPCKQSQPDIKPYHLLARSDDIRGHENFPMGCRWAPDGTCVLTATASDGKFRLYDTPFQQINSPNGDVCSNDGISNDLEADKSGALQNASLSSKSIHSWNASLVSHQGGPPPPSGSSSYSFYPLFNSSSPPTALYATCRGHSLPIHLIDAYTSELRASYRPYNSVDELEGPTVVEFSPDGSKIYGTGFKSDRTITVFDTSIPGREGQLLRLGKTRRSADGQKGIPSAIAFPKCSTDCGPSNVFAVGAYSPASIYIYDNRMASVAGAIVLHGGLAVVGHGRSFSRKKRRFAYVADTNTEDQKLEEDWFSSARVNWFQTQARGGVTQLMWAPLVASNPYVLYSASRRSNAVLSWDVRMLSCDNKNTYPVCGLKSYVRDGDTNQRIGFDLNSDGSKIYVGTASSKGIVKVYNTSSSSLEYEFEIGNDAVNGVSLANAGSRSMLAVAVGSRRFADQEDEKEDWLPFSSGNLQLYSI